MIRAFRNTSLNPLRLFVGLVMAAGFIMLLLTLHGEQLANAHGDGPGSGCAASIADPSHPQTYHHVNIDTVSVNIGEEVFFRPGAVICSTARYSSMGGVPNGTMRITGPGGIDEIISYNFNGFTYPVHGYDTAVGVTINQSGQYCAQLSGDAIHGGSYVPFATNPFCFNVTADDPDPGPGGGGGGVSCTDPATSTYAFSGTSSTSDWWFYVNSTQLIQRGTSSSVNVSFTSSEFSTWELVEVNGTVSASGTLGPCDVDIPDPDSCSVSGPCAEIECTLDSGRYQLGVSWRQLNSFAHYKVATRQYRARAAGWYLPAGQNNDPSNWNWIFPSTLSVDNRRIALTHEQQRVQGLLPYPARIPVEADFDTNGNGMLDNNIVPPATRSENTEYWFAFSGYHRSIAALWEKERRFNLSDNSYRADYNRIDNVLSSSGIARQYVQPADGRVAYIPHPIFPATNAPVKALVWDYYGYARGIEISYTGSDGSSGRFDYILGTPTQTNYASGTGYRGSFSSEAVNVPNDNVAVTDDGLAYTVIEQPPNTGAYNLDPRVPIDIPLDSSVNYELTARYYRPVNAGTPPAAYRQGDFVRRAALRSFSITPTATCEPPIQVTVTCSASSLLTGSDIDANLRVNVNWNGATSGATVRIREQGGAWFETRDYSSMSGNETITFSPLRAITQYEVQATLNGTSYTSLANNNSCITAPPRYSMSPSAVLNTPSFSPGSTVEATHSVSNNIPYTVPNITVDRFIRIRSGSATGAITQDRIGAGSPVIRSFAASQTWPVNIGNRTRSYTLPNNLVLGDWVCAVTVVRPADGTVGGAVTLASRTAERCRALTVSPYFDVSGGDVWAGAEFYDPTVGCSNQRITNVANRAFIRTDASFNRNQNRVVSGFGELGVTALGRVVGFSSAVAASPAPSDVIKDLTFANEGSLSGNYDETNKCVIDYHAALSRSSNNTDRSNTDVTLGTNLNNLSIPDPEPIKQYVWNNTDGTRLRSRTGHQYTGNYTLVFAGDVEITSNIVSDRRVTGTGSTANAPMLIIVSDGNINIDSRVTQVDALLIANGSVNTCARNGSGGIPTRLAVAATNVASLDRCNRQLEIYGAVMANRINFQRTLSSTIAANPEPAERIIYTPEMIIADHVLDSPDFTPPQLETQLIKDLPPVF